MIISAGTFVFNVMHMSFRMIDADNPPKFIQANVVDLNKVTHISKFRSGVGHDYSTGSGETCRSMKHYFYNVGPNERLRSKEELPDPVEGKDRTILSPVDGKIDRIERGERRLNDEIVLVAKSAPSVRIKLQHVTPLTGVKTGPVLAGQPIGVAGQSFDIAMERIIFPTMKTQYISFFAAMSDNAFADYQAKGMKSRDQFIFSRSQRDANPLQCKTGTEQFVKTGQPEDIPNDYITIPLSLMSNPKGVQKNETL